MIILGIDPGLAIVGWGVVEYRAGKFRPLGYGAIRTPAGVRTEERLAGIYRDLNTIIDHFHPEEMAVEELFFNTNITTGIRVAEARGIVLLCGEQKGLRISEYTPLQVKQAVVGYGRAEKKQVMAMVTSLLGLKETPKPDDTADALAIAVCHAHSGASRLAKYFNN
ncbi:MAG: crossover junction endodeoxyribonuclease RuvC [Clostridia bacterium]|nr:crossover junction endodeoxyribonuclease RuvC [Clostridia bacterium]MBR3863130.1 crossover junction endodeoxyribonuclease RuvC [Clostridia bacterium]